MPPAPGKGPLSVSLTKLGRKVSSNGHSSDEASHVGIPGSKKSHLFYQDRRPLPTCERGEGIYIFDKAGKRFIDGCSGAIAANIGHAHPRVVKASDEQMRKIAFAYRTQFENEPANELAELLARLSPPELSRVFFVNSGSEAVETAIKLARQYWWAKGRAGKNLVISRQPSYHGATLGALSATAYAPLNIPYRPMQLPFPKVAAPYCYHCPLGREYPSCEMACAWDLERQIRLCGAENIAAFICEPIGGASTGAPVPPDEWFPIVERICKENDILLIVDDVLTGCGRTGTFYGFEHWDVLPDIVCLSKGLSGAYTPLGAVVASDEIVQPVLDSGGFMHGHTLAGNPLSCAISLEVVKIVLEENLIENSRIVGAYMHERLRELMGRYPVIGDVRGRGLLAGVEFVQNRAKRDPFPPKWFVALEITEYARDHGLLIYPRRSVNGLSGDHVLICPPLIITKPQVDEMIELFECALKDLMKYVAKYLAPEPEGVEYKTFDRSKGSENIADYARGDLSAVPPEPGANVTSEMDSTASQVRFAESIRIDKQLEGSGESPASKGRS